MEKAALRGHQRRILINEYLSTGALPQQMRVRFIMHPPPPPPKPKVITHIGSGGLYLFKAICLTPVIPTPSAYGCGVRAALPNTTSGRSGRSGFSGTFSRSGGKYGQVQENSGRHFFCTQALLLRATGLRWDLQQTPKAVFT